MATNRADFDKFGTSVALTTQNYLSSEYDEYPIKLVVGVPQKSFAPVNYA